MACAVECATCTGGTASQCQTCNPAGYFLNAALSTCAATCPSGSWGNAVTNAQNPVCSPCVYPCVTCSFTSGTSCLSCSPLTYLQNNACVDNVNVLCNPGTYASSVSLTCAACATPCSKCFGATAY
jgi:proprotein convertase subtilisin/kexin type 5